MSRKSIVTPGYLHFLTFSTYQRRLLFNDRQLCHLFVECLDAARRRQMFRIIAWVIMPEHVHLLIDPLKAPYSIEKILRAIKETFSRRAVLLWEQRDPEQLAAHTIREGKRTLHRVWQPGGGYDRNLFKTDTIRKAIEYIEQNPVRRRLVSDPSDWTWSSAPKDADRAVLKVDDLGGIL